MNKSLEEETSSNPLLQSPTGSLASFSEIEEMSSISEQFIEDRSNEREYNINVQSVKDF